MFYASFKEFFNLPNMLISNIGISDLFFDLCLLLRSCYTGSPKIGLREKQEASLHKDWTILNKKFLFIRV